VPDSNLNVWVGTNPLTRKVNHIQRDPRVTLLYFHAASASYVTVIGRAAMSATPARKSAAGKRAGRRFTPTDFETAVSR
jgi:general stress protein 26